MTEIRSLIVNLLNSDVRVQMALTPTDLEMRDNGTKVICRFNDGTLATFHVKVASVSSNSTMPMDFSEGEDQEGED